MAYRNLEMTTGAQYEVLDAVDVGIIVLDDRMQVEFWNTTIEQWTGISRDEMVGEIITDRFPHLTEPRYAIRLADVIINGIPALFSSQIHKQVIPFFRPDGTESIQQTVVHPLPGDGRPYCRALFSIQDVTEREIQVVKYREQSVKVVEHLQQREIAEMELHAQFEEVSSLNARMDEANERLKELDKLKSEFISVVSHELRTPIAAVKGSAENLIGGYLGELNEGQMESLDIINRNSARLTRLVNDLLDLSQIEAGQLPMKFETIDLNNVLQIAIDTVKGVADKAECRITIEVPEGEVKIKGDSDRLIQVFINLLGNALKYTLREVKIVVMPQESAIEIAVIDDGMGIPAKQLETIFEKFHTIRDNKNKKGAGLGLSIAQGIMKAHKGRIWAENRDATCGGGAKFTVRLPKSGPDAIEYDKAV